MAIEKATDIKSVALFFYLNLCGAIRFYVNSVANFYTNYTFRLQ